MRNISKKIIPKIEIFCRNNYISTVNFIIQLFLILSDQCQKISSIQSVRIIRIMIKDQMQHQIVLMMHVNLLSQRNSSHYHDRIVLYETIKSVLKKYLEVYQNQDIYQNKKNFEVILQFSHLITQEITNILLINPHVILLNIDKNNDLKWLLKKDIYSYFALTFANLLNCVIDKVNLTQFMPFFIKPVKSDVISGDWKILAAYLICIAEFSKIKNIEQQNDLFEIITRGTKNQNLPVKYYAFHALSCFINKVNSKIFRQEYYNQIISAILWGLQQMTDYLVYKCLECFQQFILKFGKKRILSQKVDYMLRRILTFLPNLKGNKIIQYCLDCLVILAQISRLYKMQKIINCLQSCNAVILQLVDIKAEKSLLNKVIQCQCQIISNFRYHKEVQQNIDLALFNLRIIKQIQILTLPTCWRFLCLTGIKFQNWTSIFQKVFQIAKEFCKRRQQISRGLAYLTFKLTSKCFETEFAKYFIPTLQMIIPCLKKAVISKRAAEVKQICSALDTILSSQRPKSNFQELNDQNTRRMIQINKKDKINTQTIEQILQVLQYFFEIFLRQSQQVENQVKESILLSMKVLIQHYGDIIPKYYHQPLLNKFWSTVCTFNSLKNLKNQLQKQMNYTWGQESQSSNTKMKIRYRSFNRCRNTLPLILGSIIQHVPLPLPLQSNQIFDKAIIELQNQQKFCKNHFNLIYITRYMASILKFPYKQIDKLEQNFMQFFMEHSNNPYPCLRTQILYAVRIMVSKAPDNFFLKKKISHWIKIAKNCYNIPKNQFDKEEEFGTCRDNCICTFGYIIYKFGKYFDLSHLYDMWLDNLPLKYDKEQFKTQIYFLTSIVNFQHHIYIQSKVSQEPYHTKDIERFSNILRIFSEVKFLIESEPNIKQNRDTLRKVKQTAMKMSEQQIFKENSVQILDLLSQEQSAHLEELIKRQY